jgi:hypothetical protein
VINVPSRSGLNGWVPLVLVIAGRVTAKGTSSKVVPPSNAIGKVATLRLTEPPTVDTFVGVIVVSVLALPVITLEPLSAPEYRAGDVEAEVARRNCIDG